MNQHHISAKIYSFLFNGRNFKDDRNTSMSHIKLYDNNSVQYEGTKKTKNLYYSEFIDKNLEISLKNNLISNIEYYAHSIMIKKCYDINGLVINDNLNHIHLLNHLKSMNMVEDFTKLLLFYLWQESINLYDYCKTKEIILNSRSDHNVYSKIIDSLSYNKYLVECFHNHLNHYNVINDYKFRFLNDYDFIKLNLDISFVYNTYWIINYFFNLNLLNISNEKNPNLNLGLDDYAIINVELKNTILYPQQLCFSGLNLYKKFNIFQKIYCFYRYNFFIHSYIIIEGPLNYSLILSKKKYSYFYKYNINKFDVITNSFFFQKLLPFIINTPITKDILHKDTNRNKIISSLKEYLT